MTYAPVEAFAHRADADAVAQAEAAVADPAAADPRGDIGSLTVLVTSVASDSHTWNLVFLQLAIQELGHRVHNLGPCVPDELLVAECLRIQPDLVVVSSVNGHGFFDGLRLIARLRDRPELAGTPVVIGGKLGIAGPSGAADRDRLLEAGFDAVFEEAAGIVPLRSFTEHLAMKVLA